MWSRRKMRMALATVAGSSGLAAAVWLCQNGDSLRRRAVHLQREALLQTR